MQSLDPQFIAQLSFSADDAATLARLGLGQGRQELFTNQKPQALETLRQAAVVESTTSSNRLEGIVAPAKRVRALVLKSSTPQNRPEQEIAGYRDALNLIHASYAYMPFTMDVIRQLHTLLYRYLAKGGGVFKEVDNEIVERGADGKIERIRFKPTSAAETPRSVATLLERYQDARSRQAIEPLVLIPLAILDILCIHPYVDGNGRLSRLLALLLLYHHDVHVGRFISLERIFEESKQTYYEVLEQSSVGWHEGQHDPRPWMRYFWGVLVRAFDEFEERVRGPRAGDGAHGGGRAGLGRGSKSDHVLDIIRRQLGPFAISDIEDQCPGISRELIRRVLRRLRDSGEIAVQGRGRGAKWSKTDGPTEEEADGPTEDADGPTEEADGPTEEADGPTEEAEHKPVVEPTGEAPAKVSDEGRAWVKVSDEGRA